MMQLAIFDLDGTITRHDTFVPYVFGYLARHPWRLPRLLGVLPALASYALTRDRGALKSAVIRCTLGNVARSSIAEWNCRFVPPLIVRGTFGDARNRIAAHQAAGDRLILMSASPDLYVPAIAEALGFAEVICTEVRWRDQRVDGRLLTPNRRGEEKLLCLGALRTRHPGMSASAYGNSASDLDHMECVERAVFVNGTVAARRLAEQAGIRCERWR